MAQFRILENDIIKVRSPVDRSLMATLFWGDRIKVDGKENGQHVVELPRRRYDQAQKRYVTHLEKGLISGDAEFREDPLLKVRFLDVGQGDATIVETPEGVRLIIDGGEGPGLRRYVNAAFGHLMRNGAMSVDALVITHGDADHFAGMTRLINSYRDTGKKVITAEKVYHNGLVKKPGSSSKVFGTTKKIGNKTFITSLHDDLRDVADSKLNQTFQGFKKALGGLKKRNGGKPLIRRIQYGDDRRFDFLDSDIDVEVLGPIPNQVGGKDALRYYRSPGHTINGHSIILRMKYGNVRFLLGGDLNEESGEWLVERASADSQSLEAEVLKVPHHGSHEFSTRFLEGVRPVVSVVSSGDENAAKEYIHPRSGLMGALGKFSREGVDRPLIYVTEMVAFFARVGLADIHKLKNGKPSAKADRHANVYKKTTFGIVHVRTDGERVLVATHSGRDDRKESYCFDVAADGSCTVHESVDMV